MLKEFLGVCAGGLFLEVASGTGQHTAHLAAALPALTFQPTEYDAEDPNMARWACDVAAGWPGACRTPHAAPAHAPVAASRRQPTLAAPPRAPAACSIAAWARDLPNVRLPLQLDASQPDSWPVDPASCRAIFCANM